MDLFRLARGWAARRGAAGRLLLGLLLGLIALAASSAQDTLRIGSKRFTESYILAEILAQTADQGAGRAVVEVRAGLGNTAIVYQALRAGSIDLYPEYLGTIDQEILKNPPLSGASAASSSAPLSIPDLNRQLAPLGLGVAIPFGFNDGYALAMRAQTADRLGVRTLADLARQPTLRLGLSNEFIGRTDGWRGLAQRYGLPQKPTGLDHGLAYDAVAHGQVDVIDIYTTDAQIGPLDLRVLVDEDGYFPRYDAVVLYRLDMPARFPQAWRAMQSLAGSIDERAMIAMNAQAELSGKDFAAIARANLAAPGSPRAASGASQAGAGHKTAGRAQDTATGASFWARLWGPDLARLTWQHLRLVALSVAAAACVGIPLATAVAPHVRLRALVLGATGLLQTVPSLALLAVLISWLGTIGTLPALIALMLYALLPIMRNTAIGLAEVPSGLKLAGQALGLTRAQVLQHVEWPLATPTIVAGLRTATTITIGTATIAAFIGAGGFGERIVTGLALNDKNLLLAGALPAAALALLSEAAFELVERLRTRGQRH